MASELQLAIDFVVRDLGSAEFAKISERAKRLGIDLGKSFDDATKAGERQQQLVGKASTGFEQLGAAATRAIGPVGGAFEEVGRGVTSLLGGLDSVIAKAGLSSGALLGIAGAGLAAGGIVTALEAAADQAERIDQALLSAAARAKDFPQIKRQLATQTLAIAGDTGIEAEEIARATAIALAGTANDQAAARSVVLAAADAAIAGQGKIEELVRAALPSLRAFRGEGLQAKQVFNDLFQTVSAAGGDFVGVFDALGDIAPVAERFGAGFEDSLALLGAAVQEGGDVGKARTGLQKLLTIIDDTENKTHQQLERMGVDFTQAAKGGVGLAAVIQQINDAIAKQGKEKFAELFDARSAESMAAALRITVANVEQFKTAFADRDSLTRRAREVGEEPGQAIERAKEQFEAQFHDIGEGWQKLKADLFGVPLRVSVEVEFPREPQAILEQVQAKVRAGEIDAARRDVEVLQQLGDRAGVAYAEARIRALERERQRVEKINQQLRSFAEPHERAPQFEPRTIDQIPGISEEQFATQIQEMARRAQALLDNAGLKTTVDVVPQSDLPVVLDMLQTDIDRALRSFEIAPIEFRAKVLPPDVAAAQQTLDNFGKQLTNPDGSKKSTDSLDDADKTKAREAIQIILAHYQGIVQIQRLSLGIDSQTASGLDKQRVQHEGILAAIEQQLVDLRLQPDQIEKVRQKLPALREEFERLEGLATQQAGLAIQAKSIAAKEKELGTARELARANGDIAEADRLDLQIIETKAEAQRTAIQQQASADREKAGADKDQIAGIERRTQAQLRQVAAEADVSRLQAARAVDKRQEANAQILIGLQDQLVTGLDAEFLGIERAAEARRRATLEAKRGLDQQHAELDLIERIRAKNELLAQSRAKFGQLDAVQNVLGGIEDSYVAQVAAIDLSREAERERILESLAGLGTEKERIDQIVDAFDRTTAARRRQAAIGFAGQSATSLAEQQLLDNAALAGTNLTLQEQVDLISRARDGTEAWSAGWKSGTTDALRDLNDFNSGLRASHDIVIGFRDSVSSAFQGIGKDGSNFFRDLAVANLQNAQKVVSDIAADKLTLALFGPPESNKVGEDQEAVILLEAGHEMLRAALLWQQLAGGVGGLPIAGSGGNLDEFAGGADQGGAGEPLAQEANALAAAGSSASTAMEQGGAAAGRALIQGGDVAGNALSQFLGSFSNSFGSDIAKIAVGAFLPGSTGGLVYGFANGGIGRNGRRVTDPRDTIPALLRKDEYVLTPEQVSALGGAGQLDGLNNGRTPDRDKHAGVRARERDSGRGGGRDSAAPAVTFAPVINLQMGDIHVSGRAGDDPKLMAREVAEQARRAVTQALESGSDRRLVEAVRGAGR